MARTASSSTTKERLNKGQIAKIAEDVAKKTAKKESGRVARNEASKVAAKVATEAALNPDYELNDEDEVTASGLLGWDSDEDEDEEDEDGEEAGSGLFRSFGSSSRASSYSSDDDDDTEDNADLAKDVKNRDIFAYSNDLMNKGTPVRLQIKKNGQFLTTIKKPYSEEQLQKDYGEGHYAVILRNDIKGTFIKQQSFSIAAPPQVHQQEIVKLQQEKQEEKIDKMFQTFSQMQAAQSDSQQQLFERLMEEQRRREEEEKERRREEREIMKYQESNNTNMIATVLQAALSNKGDDSGGTSAILQIMQSQQNQTTQMIMESNKNFMMMIQEMRRDTQTMMEKVSQMGQEQAREFRNQIAEMSNKKQDGFDPVTMFKMLNDTRESGMNFGLKINELAKQIAESDIQPQQPKGIVESVLDNIGKFAPLMLSAAQSNQAAQHFNSPAAQAVPQQALVPVPPAPTFKKPSTTPSAAPARPVVPKPQVVAAPRTNPTNAKPTQPNTVVVKPTIAKPVIAKPTTQNVGQVKTTTVAAPNTNSVANGTEGAKINAGTASKDEIIDVCVPLIGHALSNNLPHNALGDATLNAFNLKGIDPKVAVQTVTVDDVLSLAFTKFSLPQVPELTKYFRDYHDYLFQKASTQKPGETARPTA